MGTKKKGILSSDEFKEIIKNKLPSTDLSTSKR
jgi:hypothetical protein